MYVFEWTSKLIISKYHACSQLLEFKTSDINFSYSSSQTGMHTKIIYSLMHVKFISRISREVLTCYISSLESISSVVFKL